MSLSVSLQSYLGMASFEGKTFGVLDGRARRRGLTLDAARRAVGTAPPWNRGGGCAGDWKRALVPDYIGSNR